MERPSVTSAPRFDGVVQRLVSLRLAHSSMPSLSGTVKDEKASRAQSGTRVNSRSVTYHN